MPERGLAPSSELAILTEMTELGGGGYEKRAGSGIPRRDRPDRSARPEAPTGSAGSPSDPMGDGGVAPAGAADLPDPDPAWSTSTASTPESTTPESTTAEPTTAAQPSPSSGQQIVLPAHSSAPTGLPPQSETTHGPSGPATGWSIPGWSGAPGQLTGITPLSDPNPPTGPYPLPGRVPSAGTTHPLTATAWADRGDLDEQAALDRHPNADGYPGETDSGGEHADADTPPAGTGERRGLAGRARSSRRLLAIVAGAVLVLIAAVAIVALRGGDDDKGGDAPTASGTLPPVPANFLSTAAVDADPITPDEFFPEQSVAVDTHGYQRLARKLDAGCPNLTGDLIVQLKAARCRQVVRSLFLSRPQQGERQVLAGATVFSLDTSATATQAAQVLNQGRGGIAPLPIPAGSIQNAQITGPGGNNSWRGAVSRGHYLIYTQVAYVDGTSGTATDQPLRNAQTDLATLATEPIGDRAVLGHGPRR